MAKKQHSRTTITPASIVTLLLLSATSTAANNDIFDLDLESLGQIQVSRIASSFPVNDLDVGSSVSVITRQDWQRYDARRWNEAVQHVPGLMVYPTLGGSNALAIRGFASSLSVRGIATLIDDVPMNTLSYGTGQYSLSFLGINTLNRLEIIRGPGSSLYGSDAFHGVLSATSYQRQYDEHRLGTRTDERGFMQWWGLASRSLGEAHRLHVAAEYSDQPDQQRAYSYVDSLSGSPEQGLRANAYETSTINLKLTGHLDSATQYRVGYLDHDFDSSKFSGTGRELFEGLDLNRNRDWSDGNARVRMSHLFVEHELAQAMVISGLLYSWESAVAFDFDQTHVLNRTLRLDQVNRRHGGKLELKQRNRAWHTDWKIGLETTHLKIDKARSILFTPDDELLASVPSAFDGLNREIHSLTLQATTRFLQDRLALLYGTRIDRYSTFGTQTTPRLGVIYRPDSRTAWKALYGNAFRAAVAGELTESGSIDGNPDIRPEEIDTYELIFIRHHHAVRLEAVAFYSRWHSAIGLAPHPDPDSGFESIYSNQGVLTTAGLEGQLDYRHENHWVNTTLTYAKSKDDTQDKRFTAFPSWIISLDTGFQFTDATSLSLIQRIHLDATESPSSLSAGENNPLRHYWRTDLILRHDIATALRSQIAVRNLFNRRNAVPALWNMAGGIPDEPQTLLVSLEWSLP